MKSLNHYTMVTGGIAAVIVALLALLTYSNIGRLERAEHHLTNDIMPEHQLLEDYQEALYLLVNHAHTFERTRQYNNLHDARDSLQQARDMLPNIREVSLRNETDPLVLDRHAQRIALLNDADQQLQRLERSIENNDDEETTLALQRLDLVAQDARTLGRASHRQLDQQTFQAIDNINSAVRQVHLTNMGNLFIVLVLVGIALLMVRTRFIQDLQVVLAAVNATAAGDLNQHLVVNSQHEIGQLKHGFNRMVDSLKEQQHNIQQRAAELEQANEKQRMLIDTINALSAPILPLQEDILVLPIVGTIDEPRAQHITRELLRAVHERRARIAILDITGLAAIDTTSATMIVQTIQAAHLLGAEVTLAGVSAQFARDLVARHTALDTIHSYATLQDALEEAMERSATR